MRSLLLLLICAFTFGLQAIAQDEPRANTRTTSDDPKLFRVYLDSADVFKKTDIETSIDYIAQALALVNEPGREQERALSLTKLGEIYQYHRQYDLAIANYQSALDTYKSTKTALLLAEVLLISELYVEAEQVLQPLLTLKSMLPYQRILLYEYLGDVKAGFEKPKEAVAFYEEGLVIARKNRITPKIPDLNSKIADVYAQADRIQEAEGYYNYSLEQAASQPPQRAVKEKEKVADFYNRENRYEDEIKLRKQSLSTLKSIPAGAAESAGEAVSADTITSQRINYKIANAYLAQDKYDEAISFLQESIRESEDENDLETKKEATRSLSELYREKGDYSKALETYQQYVAVVDTLYKQKEEAIAQAARFSREISAKQSRISSLEKDWQLSQSRYELASTQQQLIEETNRRQRWVIYSLLVVIGLIALAAFFFYRSNKQQKLANNLLALKSLRTQMNPHFIFNALNSVNSYIAKSDEKSANKYVSDFSQLMRSVLENSEEEFIPLNRELELIRLYLKLEHSRFPDKFDYQVESSPDAELSDFQIPPMLLQPFVENAVWHGLRYKEDKGYLRVVAEKRSADEVVLIVEDNGIGRKASAKLKTRHQNQQKSTGMKNIEKRLEILNAMGKDQIMVEVGDLSKDGAGTRVLISINKK